MTLTCVTATFNVIRSGNRARLIRCIESVAALKTDHEHLIYDGASTDGTLELLRDLAARIPTLKIASEPDKGIYNALNKGVRDAKGEWFYVLGADDYLVHPEVMDEILAAEDADTAVVATPVEVMAGAKRLVKMAQLDELKHVFQKPVVCHQGEVVRTRIMREFGGFDERYRISADRALFLAMRLKGLRFHHVLDIFASYSFGGASNQQEETALREDCAIVERLLGMTADQSAFYERTHLLPLALALRYGRHPDEALQRGARWMLRENLRYGLACLLRPFAPMGTLVHDVLHGVYRRLRQVRRISRMGMWRVNLAQFQGVHQVTIALTHDLLGGADDYLKHEAAALPDGEALLCVEPTDAPLLLRVKCLTAKGCTATFLIPSLKALVPLAGHCSRILVNELVHWEEFEGGPISVAQYDRLVGAVLALQRRLKVPMRYLVHDYYSICPRFALTARDGRYCRSEVSCAKCSDCFKALTFIELKFSGIIDIAAWRSVSRRLLLACDEVRAFSEDSRARMIAVFPGLAPTVVPHADALPFARVPRLSTQGCVIGVFGNIFEYKGAREVVDLANYLDAINVPDVRIVVVGRLITDLPLSPRIRVLGAYQRADLPDIVEREGINVAFFSSVCLETFSFVVSELMALGLPIACYDMGAPRDRVRAYAKGAIIPDLTSEDTWRTIRGLL